MLHSVYEASIFYTFYAMWGFMAFSASFSAYRMDPEGFMTFMTEATRATSTEMQRLQLVTSLALASMAFLTSCAYFLIKTYPDRYSSAVEWCSSQVICTISLWLTHIGNLSYVNSASEIYGRVFSEWLFSGLLSILLIFIADMMIEDVLNSEV